jgi:hypothetical protein
MAKMLSLMMFAALGLAGVAARADPPMPAASAKPAEASAFQRGLTMMMSAEDKEWGLADNREYERIHAVGGGGSPSLPFNCAATPRAGTIDMWTGKPLTTCDPPVVQMYANIHDHFSNPDIVLETARILFGDAATWSEEAKNPMGGTVTVTHARLGTAAWVNRCQLELKFPESVCVIFRQIPFYVQCAKSFKEQLAQEKATKTFWQNGFLHNMSAPRVPIPQPVDSNATSGVSITPPHCPRAATDAQIKAWGAEAQPKK